MTEVIKSPCMPDQNDKNKQWRQVLSQYLTHTISEGDALPPLVKLFEDGKSLGFLSDRIIVEAARQAVAGRLIHWQSPVISVGNYSYDTSSQRLTLPNGHEAKFSYLEGIAFEALMERPTLAVPRLEILRRLYYQHTSSIKNIKLLGDEIRLVKVVIYYVRQRMGDQRLTANPSDSSSETFYKYIQNVRGFGYSFDPRDAVSGRRLLEGVSLF